MNFGSVFRVGAFFGAFIVGLSISAKASLAQDPTITEIELATANSAPTHIVRSGTKLWFILSGTSQVARANVNGTIEDTFTLVNAPTSLAANAEGDILVTQRASNAIVKIPQDADDDSDVAAFATFDPGSGPNQIVLSDDDDSLWVTLTDSSKIAKISGTTVTTYDTDTANSQPIGISNGPSDFIWFTEFASNKIGKIDSDGNVTEYSITTAASGPNDIVEGADNNLWFTEYNTNKIGKITTSGTVTEYTVPMAGVASSQIRNIIQGPAGTPLWFTLTNDNKIGQITPAGTIKALTSFTTANSSPFDLTVSSDDNIWVTQFSAGGNSIAKVVPTDVVELTNSSTLPAGERSVAYSQTLTGTGGTAPYTYALFPGDSLISGLTLSSDGTLSGTPTVTGTSQFQVVVTDSEGVYNVILMTLTVSLPDRPDLSVALTGVRYSSSKGLRGKGRPINIGSQPSGAFTYKFYLSKNPVFDSSDKAIRTVSQASLAANGEKGSGVRLSYNNSVGKYKYLLACADPDGAIIEQIEDNNCDYKKFTGRK